MFAKPLIPVFCNEYISFVSNRFRGDFQQHIYYSKRQKHVIKNQGHCFSVDQYFSVSCFYNNSIVEMGRNFEVSILERAEIKSSWFRKSFCQGNKSRAHFTYSIIVDFHSTNVVSKISSSVRRIEVDLAYEKNDIIYRACIGNYFCSYS